MTRHALLALLLLLLLAACAEPPVRDELTIALSRDGSEVVLTAETRFELDPRNAETRARVDAAREAAISGNDPWSVRFSRLTPTKERVTYERTRGKLESVTRMVRVPEDDLPRVFSDVAITAQVLHGDGWSELAMYPGTSSRASREQQRKFHDSLAAWSAAVARYFTAVHHLYAYLDDNPGRARYVFAALMSEKDAAVLEDEEPLVEAVVSAMTAIGERMDAQDAEAATFAEMADLMFNPFPARIVVRAPGEVLAVEGFAAKKDELTIERIDLFRMIANLEGKWISPDPLVQLLRDDKRTSEELAELPRRSTPLTHASEVADALRAELARPRAYVVRWRD